MFTLIVTWKMPNSDEHLVVCQVAGPDDWTLERATEHVRRDLNVGFGKALAVRIAPTSPHVMWTALQDVEVQ